jgi:hypothetical protein
MLCKSCKGSCEDSEGVEINCPSCNGSGCEQCNNGRFQVKGCPKQEIDATTLQTLEFSEWIEKGFLPSEGGLLNQSASLMAHCKAYGNEVNRIEAERWTKQ